MKTWRSTLSIRWILPVAVVTPVLALALVLTALAYSTGRRTANEFASENTRQIHERIEDHLNRLMDLPPAINQLSLSRLRAGRIELDDPARSRMAAFETLRTFPEVSSVALGSVQGQVMWVIRYPGEKNYEFAIKTAPKAPMQEFAMDAQGEIGPDALRSYSFDTTMRPWYRAAIDADAPTWGNIYVWERGGKGVTLGIPYVEPYRDAQGRPLGVINCEITLSDISAFLQRLQVGKSGVAFILDRDGNLVASSTGLQCMTDTLGRLNATAAPDSRIAEAAGRISAAFKAPADIDGLHVMHPVIDKAPSQMVVSYYQNRRNLDWRIVTLVPDADFLAEVRHTREKSMMIGAFAVLAALAGGAWIALWLLKPVLALVAHARRVGGGDLDARIDRHDNREIAELSAALNEMADGLRDRLRLRQSLKMAMEVQQSLLPSRIPVVRGLDIAARSQYCDETGGDYYDYLQVEGIGDDALAIALGDVMGHGIAAAMLMASARGALRSHSRLEGSLGNLLENVNDLLVADARKGRFMTMFLGVLDVRALTLRWASAGHDQPLLYDPETKTVSEIEASGGGVPLGIEESEKYNEQTHVGLRPGQIMLIGTDGLWESKNAAGQMFGKERVGEAMVSLAHLPAAEIVTGVYQRMQAFCGERAIDDDITFIIVRIISDSLGMSERRSR